MPAISVLLPVRNAGPYLDASLRSLWRQRFTDFEVIAVDDGSTDGSDEQLERAARREPRLRVLHTAARGLPAALTTALAHARAARVARHDADDVCHRDRLGAQQRYLDSHPAVAVVGCRVRLFPASQVGAGMRRWMAWHNALLDHEPMAREALIDSPLAHGTALLRRSWLERVGGWRDRPWPEDMDLWLRMIAAGARLAKLPQVLYGWRQHPGSATRRDPRYGRARFRELRLAALQQGPLRAAAALTVVGVGESLLSWQRALRDRGYRVDAVEARSARDLPARGGFMLLVFGARRARETRRSVLLDRGLREGSDFVFVA